MNLFVRWCRFNAVGAMGMALQLAALGLLERASGGHYMAATAAAVEVTVLHNFVWHLHYTWKDRRDQRSVAGRLVRFHLSNGMVSLLGNLALMRVLVARLRMPVLAANGIAVLICSMLNFGLSHIWAFAEQAPIARKCGESKKSALEVLPETDLRNL